MSISKACAAADMVPWELSDVGALVTKEYVLDLYSTKKQETVCF